MHMNEHMPDPARWSRHLHMRHLHWLLLLEECGSLSEAARRAHTSQPGLSTWLRMLEEDVGNPLFERHARGINPTPAGQLLLMYARRVRNAMQRAESDLHSLRGGHRRNLLLAASPAATFDLVPNALAHYLPTQPQVHVTLREGTLDELLPQLARAELDIVVGRLDAPATADGLEYEWLHVEPIMVISRPGHALAGHPAPTWPQALDQGWIGWPPGTPIRRNFEHALTEAGLQPPVPMVESGSMSANIALMRESDLLLPVSRHVAGHFVALGQARLLPLRMGSAGALGMYWREATGSDPAIAGLITQLRRSATRLRAAAGDPDG